MKGRTLALAGVAVAGLVVARRLSAPQQMPHLALWQRALGEKRGEAEAAQLVARAESRYDELYARRPHLPSRALRFHLQRGILPGLALYQAMLESGLDRQAALAEIESLPISALAGLRRLLPLLGRLPDPFAVFRRVESWGMRFGLPVEGWDFEPLEDSEDCVAFNIRRCFYLDTLSSYGAPELTPVYCAQDDVLFALLPPSITWERTMTLGRGHDRCDFRWCRAVPQGTISGARER
jgi:hypothetical protein